MEILNIELGSAVALSLYFTYGFAVLAIMIICVCQLAKITLHKIT